MLLEILERIAREEDAQLQVTEERVPIEDGASGPHVVILFTLTYKGRKVQLQNVTGTRFFGQVSCELCNSRDSLEFELTTISNFSNLFLRKDKFKIREGSPNIDSFLRKSSGLAQMKEIALNTVFEPRIVGKNNEGRYHLITEYSLQFSDWTQAIRPIIKFYREFIDQFADRNVSDK